MKTYAPSLFLLAALWSSGAAWQPAGRWICEDNIRYRETVLVSGYVDSLGLARTVKTAPPIGSSLIMARNPEDRETAAPFPGLFRLADAPCEKVADLDCRFGWRSREYALMHRGSFRRLTAQDVYLASGKRAGWNEWASYLGLGSKLKTPASLALLRKALDSAGLRTDTAYALPEGARWDSLAGDPGFGVFYTETCSRAFVYGIRYRLTADSIRLIGLTPYFRFRNPSPYNEWLDGASAVYLAVQDTADFHNMRRAREFMAGRLVRGADFPLDGP